MTSLLDTVQSPLDIKNFDPEQLDQLASDIRQKIIDVLSK
ncbi:MAG: hypothetical protein FJZ57_08700, partial [Chlamydiae bacterium]|nr:hypothetical protein [Chlamydiota bacterium]